ncbi:hypothetical protein IC582_025003 [Cucumis melo]
MESLTDRLWLCLNALLRRRWVFSRSGCRKGKNGDWLPSPLTEPLGQFWSNTRNAQIRRRGGGREPPSLSWDRIGDATSCLRYAFRDILNSASNAVRSPLELPVITSNLSIVKLSTNIAPPCLSCY